MLEVKNLTCGYGAKTVINGVTFNVQKGEKLCVLGANGSGKTTLLRGLAGILGAAGQVFVNGEDILKLPPEKRARRIALMSQFSAPAYGYTAYEAVLMGRYAHTSAFSDYSQNDRRVVESCMERTGVLDIAKTRMTELSGGQTQRVFLARAFAQEPDILLLDEPMNHLDLKARRALTYILDEWVSNRPRAVIGVFHDISPALTFSNSALLLLNGEMIAKCALCDLDFKLLDVIYGMDVRGYMRALAEIWL